MEEQTTTPKKLTMKEKFLAVAEVIDAYRLIPRAFLFVYGVLVYKLYTWFVGIGTAVKTQCDKDVIQVLLANGVDLVQAQEIACTVVEVVGGPTTAQAAFVTTIVGLATAVFAFYANTGRSWGTSKKNSE